MDHLRDLGPKTSPNDPKVSTLSRLFNGQSKRFAAISPLFAMVGLAFALAGWTGVHQLYANPSVIVDKKKRRDPVEMEYPDEARRKGQIFAEQSPLYKLSKSAKPTRAVAEVQHLPTILPGDESSADNSGGTMIDRGRRGGGI